MEKIKSVMLCILLLCIILLRTCDNLNPNCSKDKVHDTTIVIKEKWDTVLSSPKIIYLKVKNLTPIESFTVIGTPASFDTLCSLKRIYSDSIQDSNLVFRYTIETQGIMTNFKPSYKLFIPYQIIHTIDKTVELTEKPKIHLYGGLQLDGNSKQFGMSPFIAITDKKKNIYDFGYNVIEKTYIIGFGIKLR